MERWCAGAGLALAILLLMSVSGARAGPGDRFAIDELLVRFHAEGPHALKACAESRSRKGLPFASVTADGSDSLDALHQRLGVRSVRAVFRRPDTRTFDDQRQALRQRLAGGRSPDSIPDLAHIYRVRLAAGSDVERAVALYAADSHVAWAQPDFRVDLDVVPDDPFFSAVGSWGQSERDLWGLERIRASEAWDQSQGEGVVVAVVDTGVDPDHPDLADNLWVNPGEDLNGNGRPDPEERNGLDDDANGFVDDLYGFDFANSIDANEDGDYDDLEDESDPDPFDDNGHGTHVAGTIAAVGNNGIGVIGVAPKARIMGLKGFPAGGGATIETLARAMVYAVENGARVINNSWSCSHRCPSNPVAEEAVRLAHAHDVVVVTSAGNRRDDVIFYSPEKLRETIVVGATTPTDQQASFTNTGLRVDVVAPGAGAQNGTGFFPQRGILSLLSSGAGPAADGFGAFVVGGDYLRWSGTSMSAPHVAGLAALILGLYPELDFEGVRARVRAGVQDLGVPGHDAIFGAGRIDAARALALEPLDLRAAFTSPEQGAIVDVGAGRLVVRGSVVGSDLAHWSLSLGSAPTPTEWEPLLTEVSEPLEDGLLLSWELDDRPVGAYALRLQAEAQDGRIVQEFLVLSIERTAPRQISFNTADAVSARVSGDLVVWESSLPGDLDEQGRAFGSDLFLADLAKNLEGPVVRVPGDQRSAVIDGQRLVWLDGVDDAHALFGCEIDPNDGSCLPEPIATGESRRDAPTLANGRVVWSESVRSEGAKLMACQGPTVGECEPLPLALAGTQVEPSFDGDLLLWVQQNAGRQLMSCDLSQRDCQPLPISGAMGVADPVSSSGLFAWSLPSGAGSLLFACVRDSASLACPPTIIGLASPGAAVAISGDRLVWHGQAGGGSDIFLCEFDRRTGDCPIQRLTSSMANERRPRIDGDRVVWEDDRGGVFQIYGLELPRLSPLPDRRIGEGRNLRMKVQGSDPSGAPLGLSAQLADGRPLDTIDGLLFRDLGHGRGLLSWYKAQAGIFDVTVIGTSTRGLQTRHTLRIEGVPGGRGKPDSKREKAAPGRSEQPQTKGDESALREAERGPRQDRRVGTPRR